MPRKHVHRTAVPFRLFLFAVALALAAAPLTAAGEAPDATGSGPFATASGEYKLPAQVYADVRAGEETELWATTYYPTDATGDLPLVFVLHGNHSTCGRGSNPRIDDNCQYTNSGTCPNGYVVVPNQAGYEYFTEPLASWGYVVVSINANRGINCAFGDPGDSGLNKARGRLILKHMQFVSGWNMGLIDLPGGFDPALEGRLDFDEVGLLGHSRGGEGARAAYNFYIEPGSEWVDKIGEPVSIQSIFEIGAVDGQTDTVFDATSVVWNQLLPMCDGDVSSLEGVRPLDRMMNELREANPTAKSSYTVWGANHNYFNTEWQSDDSQGCIDHPQLPAEVTGSAAQRVVGRSAAMAMVRGAVGTDADGTFLRNFNPAFDLPTEVVETTRVDRAFIDSPRGRIEAPLENFSAAAGINRWGFDNDDAGITLSHTTVPDHDSDLRAAQIDWGFADPGRFLQVNVADRGEGRDFSNYSTLDFRVSRQTSQPEFLSSTDFSISLLDADGVESSRVVLSDYTDLTGPVGADSFFTPLRHPICRRRGSRSRTSSERIRRASGACASPSTSRTRGPLRTTAGPSTWRMFGSRWPRTVRRFAHRDRPVRAREVSPFQDGLWPRVWAGSRPRSLRGISSRSRSHPTRRFPSVTRCPSSSSVRPASRGADTPKICARCASWSTPLSSSPARRSSCGSGLGPPGSSVAGRRISIPGLAERPG